ncbi:MAG: diaminopimelate epimerase [Alphaproteobacteria bacterium]|nr:diaminopimelate epimerase [Alphaproteobacteria bacterium]
MTLQFIKMSGAGNDFVIFDARKTSISLTQAQIKKISDRKNIGCDQLIVIRNSDEADCVMEIYNSDGSMSGACGNATRCVASLLEKDEIKIKTAAGILECRKNGELVSVNMGRAKIGGDVDLQGFSFTCIDVGNPHAVTFLQEKITDENFFYVGPKVETNKYFPNKTNVEFARILSDDLIEVRVWERGAGETLACGSGACAVAVAAISKGLVKSKKITTRFKGGDLQIEWNGVSVIMTGGYEKIFDGVVDAEILSC